MDTKLEQTLIRLFHANGNSPTEAIRAYRRKTGKKCPLDECQVRRLLSRFNDTGSAHQRRPGSGRPSCSKEDVDDVLQVTRRLSSANPYGMTSVRQVSADTDVHVSKTTVHKILTLEGLHPYRPCQVQQLLPRDYGDRVAFSERALEELLGDFENVLWTDEAIFSLTPNVSSLCGAVWRSQPPHVTVPKPLHPQTVHVWSGFSGRLKMPPFFFESTVTGDAYHDMLATHCIPFLCTHRSLSRTIFQQDGAAPHIAAKVKELLRSKFGSRVISRHFEFPWPARSPDLTPMDFFFWGYVKQKVYSRHIAQVADLKEAISTAIEEIDQDLLGKVVASVPERLKKIIENEGHPILKC